jgi:hypothetical protein
LLNLRNRILGIVPLIFCASIFWKPALLDGKSIIHGDSIVHGLALLTLQFESFHHLGQLLWSDGIYGGHPLFAEGQGAFASPFNMILAWIIAPMIGPIPTMNLAHWLSMVMTGVGVLGLCRCLGASRMSASFASIAVVFSAIWIGAAQNMTISGALIWVPWAFWAMEVWLRRPSVNSAILMGAAVAMIVLAGYPQAFHGAVIYMALTLAVVPFDAMVRRRWTAECRARLATGSLAILVCAGLSAIQWLPLLELTALSHRSGGIASGFRIPLIAYLRGFLFTAPGINGSASYFPGTGSLLVSALASLALVARLPNRIKGHLLAALILVQLGGEEASPLFRLLDHNDLLPGLRYFRTFHLYINIAIIGFGVLAATVIDGMSGISLSRGAVAAWVRANWTRISASAMMLAIWFWAILYLRIPDIGWVNYSALAAALAGSATLIVCRRGGLVPAFMVLLLTAECMNLRLYQFHFYDPAILAEPASAEAIKAIPAHRDDKLFDSSWAGFYGFTDSRDPGEPDQARRVMESITAMTNIFWGLRSMNGALALPTHRQTDADKLMRSEIDGQTASPPGARLIDLLAVRFISVDPPHPAPAFRPFWSDPAVNAQIMENMAARGRFQIYENYMTVASPAEALDAIKALKAPMLVIENLSGQSLAGAPQVSAVDNGAVALANNPASFDVLKAKSTDYRIDITAARPVWFFIADANYPGWKATLDGKPTPLFSAQLLGKAVTVPPGRHRLAIRFQSATFDLGLGISLASIIGLGLFTAWRRLRSMRPAIGRFRQARGSATC